MSLCSVAVREDASDCDVCRRGLCGFGLAPLPPVKSPRKINKRTSSVCECKWCEIKRFFYVYRINLVPAFSSLIGNDCTIL